MTMQDLELTVLVDACGDYAIGKDADAAREAYENDVGALNECPGFRLFNVKLSVPLPAEVELAGEVKAEPETATALSVAAAK